MKNKAVLISGAGIAGPALAYWLGRRGFEPCVVERAPRLREGGQAVDFRGGAQLEVLGRMGILEEVRAQQTHMGEQAFVDEAGGRIATLPAEFLSGEVEILRGDLSRILYDASRVAAEYRFGDEIVALTGSEEGVEVSFAKGPARRFDLVIGADGLHSGVRALAFGDEGAYLGYLGYHVAGFSLPNHLGLRRTGLICSAPGRGVCLSSGRDPNEARALFVFASEALPAARRLDVAWQKQLVRRSFAGMSWEVPRLLAALDSAADLYFDAVARVDLDRASNGRVALLGDAAFGGTLGGQGTGAALIGAYVLAGELAAAGGDHRAAFARYEARVRPYAARCQKGAAHAGPFLAPRSRAGLWGRNQFYRLLCAPPFKRALHALVTSAADDIALEDYRLGAGAALT